MSALFRRVEFQPSCPSGGKFYVCDSGSKFVGCCKGSPCVNGCSDGNLSPASFNPDAYDFVHEQSCPQGSRWYTCQKTDPPFLGCCKSDPCKNRCPVGDLTAAFLSSNPALAAQYLSYGSSATISSKPTSTGGSSRTSSAFNSQGPTAATGSSRNTSAAAQPAAGSSSQKESHAGAIAGGVGGGIFLLIMLGALLLCYRTRKNRKSPKQLNELNAQPEKPRPMYADGGSIQSGMQDQKLASQHGTPYSTPAPRYPHSSPLPQYPSSPTAEMDGSSQFKPHPAPYSDQTYTSSQNPLGINPVTDQRPYSGGYVAYKPSTSSAVQAPLVQPMVELESPTGITSFTGHAMSYRPPAIATSRAD